MKYSKFDTGLGGPRRPPSTKGALIDLNTSLDEISKYIVFRGDTNLLNDVEFYTLILEDRRYFRHSGFDPLSAIRVACRAVAGSNFGGASTIEMQFVRVCTERYERSVRRKIREIVLSFLLQWQATKFSILRSYLEVAYFGSGIKGVEQASKKVFGSSSSILRGYDAAFIAAMLVYPRPLEPNATWFTKTNRRALYALRVGSKLEQRFHQIRMR